MEERAIRKKPFSRIFSLNISRLFLYPFDSEIEARPTNPSWISSFCPCRTQNKVQEPFGRSSRRGFENEQKRPNQRIDASDGYSRSSLPPRRSLTALTRSLTNPREIYPMAVGIIGNHLANGPIGVLHQSRQADFRLSHEEMLKRFPGSRTFFPGYQRDGMIPPPDLVPSLYPPFENLPGFAQRLNP